MQAKKKIFYVPPLLMLMSLLAGCTAQQKLVDIISKPDSAQHHSAQVESTKRFEKSSSSGQTVVESAIELSKQLAELSRELVVLKQQKFELITENERLKKQLVSLEPELTQTKEELAQANDLLIEMRIELNNWKTDIIGYRDEMRDANRAQLEVLLKIAEALGAQIAAESDQEQNELSYAAATNTSGEPYMEELSNESGTDE